jgi:transcriptional regulator with XRE-family HTH domain
MKNELLNKLMPEDKLLLGDEALRLFGLKLTQWRKYNSITQVEFGKKLGIGRGSIMRIEKGKPVSASYYFIVFYALLYLDVDLNKWFEEIYISLDQPFKNQIIENRFKML